MIFEEGYVNLINIRNDLKRSGLIPILESGTLEELHDNWRELSETLLENTHKDVNKKRAKQLKLVVIYGDALRHNMRYRNDVSQGKLGFTVKLHKEDD